jgi:hypothetical protein
MNELLGDIKDVENRTGLGVVIGEKPKEVEDKNGKGTVVDPEAKEYFVLLVNPEVHKDIAKMVMLQEVDLQNFDNRSIREDLGGGTGDTPATALATAYGAWNAMQTRQQGLAEHRAIAENWHRNNQAA